MTPEEARETALAAQAEAAALSAEEREIAASAAFEILANDEVMGIIIDNIEWAIEETASRGGTILYVDVHENMLPDAVGDCEEIDEYAEYSQQSNGVGHLFLRAPALYFDYNDIEDWVCLLEVIAQMYFQDGYKVGCGHAMDGMSPHRYRSSAVGALFNKLMFGESLVCVEDLAFGLVGDNPAAGFIIEW